MAKSIQKLLERIRNRDIKATFQLMSITDPSIINQLLMALGDYNEFVRGYASFALTNFDSPHVIGSLIDMLDSPDELYCTKVIDTLALMNARGAIGKIKEKLNHPNQMIVLSALRAVKKMKDDSH